MSLTNSIEHEFDSTTPALRVLIVTLSLLAFLFLSACSANKSTVHYPLKQNHLNAPGRPTTSTALSDTLPAPTPGNSKSSPKNCALPQAEKLPSSRPASPVRVTVTKTKDVAEPMAELEKVVNRCRDFLYGHFGMPRFAGKLKIIFTTNPADNGRMIWTQSNSHTRKILLNSLNLYCDNESTLWGIIVHELFHGLYQTESLIKNSPEFILEAQASYAQYLANDYFINGKASNRRIYKLLVQKYQGIQCNRSSGLNLNARFSAYGQCSTDQLYLLGAIMYANPENGIPAVKRTLLQGNGKDSAIRDWALQYNIHITGGPLAEFLAPYRNYAVDPVKKMPKPAYNKQPAGQIQGQEYRRNIEIQRLLRHIGLYAGRADGILGQNTVKAIKKFQYLNKLPSTGKLDNNTQDLLFARGVAEGLWK